MPPQPTGLVAQLLRSAVSQQNAGRLSEAASLYRQVLTIDPAQPDALYLLGLVRFGEQEIEEAAKLLKRALGVRPNHAPALNALGIVERSRGDIGLARQLFSRASEKDPSFIPALMNAAAACGEAGDLRSAYNYYRRASRVAPANVDAHLARANLAARNDDEREAEDAYGQALRAAPNQPRVLAQFVIYLSNKRDEKAQRVLDEALSSHPENADLLRAQARVFNASSRFSEALMTADRTIRLDARSSGGWFERGVALGALDRVAEAIDSYRQASAIAPNLFAAQQNLGVLLNLIGENQEARAVLQSALSRSPGDPEVAAALLVATVGAAEISGEDLLEFTRRIVASLPQPPHVERHPIQLEPERPLRIGYVSGDFRAHSCAFFSYPLISHHDSARFESVCYATNDQPDDVTQKFREASTQWRNIAWQSDDQAAQMIVEDRIDILVDLSGWTQGKRPNLFRRKPAPIQGTWLGFPGPTGIAEIDFRIGDPLVDPKGLADSHFNERLIRLDRPFLSYAPPYDAPEPAEPPPDSPVCFGSFNNLSKLTDMTLHHWGRILQRVPGSRLLLKSKATHDGRVADRCRERMQALGVDIGRVDFLDWQPGQLDHLRQYSRLHIALDTWPYNGTTTTLEALWMGVPVIGLVGGRHAARVGGALLTAAGLRELVADSAQRYEDLAVALATDPGRVRQYRATLRERALRSSLLDHAGFAAAVEAVYRQVWREYCASQGR